jgi:hypothetical protein
MRPTPHVAIAIARSSGGNVSMRIACEEGTIAAPPSPWITRKTTIVRRSGAAPHAIDAPVKITTLAMK